MMAPRKSPVPDPVPDPVGPARDRPAFLLAFSFFLCFLAGMLLVLRGPDAKTGDDGETDGGGRDGIAVLDIQGTIQFSGGRPGLFGGQSSAAGIAERIRRFGENPRVRGLVLRINSPGGSVAATQEIYNAVKRFRALGKPVVASLGDIAASGGYYVACASQKIFANPGSLTGSIGVIISAPDMKGLYEWARIRWNVIASGKYKDILSPLRNMREDERVLLTEMVRDAYRQFFAAVREAREITGEKLEELAQGQVFSGNQAKELGLVDETGDFEDALRAVGEMAGLRGRPHPIRVREGGGLGQLLELLDSSFNRDPFPLLPAQPSRLPGYASIDYLYRGF
jgi:protease-4